MRRCLIVIPFLLLLTPALGSFTTVLAVHGQQPIRDPFIPMNLSNTIWTLYNESSGSSSIMKFNDDGTYTRNLHGNNLTGNWQSNIVIEQRVQLCPTEPKWTAQCILVGFRVDNP